MSKRHTIQAIVAHIITAGITFLILTMAAQIGLGLKTVLKGLPANLPLRAAYFIGDVGLEIFCVTVVVANILPFVIAKKGPSASVGGLVIVTSAICELLWAMVLFTVVTFAAISTRL